MARRPCSPSSKEQMQTLPELICVCRALTGYHAVDPDMCPKFTVRGECLAMPGIELSRSTKGVVLQVTVSAIPPGWHAEEIGHMVISPMSADIRAKASGATTTKGRIMSWSSCSRMWQWYMYLPQ